MVKAETSAYHCFQIFRCKVFAYLVLMNYTIQTNTCADIVLKFCTSFLIFSTVI